MPNLVRFLVDLADDDDVRSRFRADPSPVLDELAEETPGGVTGEDVEAAAEVARHRLEPAIADRSRTARVRGTAADEAPRQAALRHLLAWCDRVEGNGDPDEGDHDATGGDRVPPDATVIGFRLSGADEDDTDPTDGLALPAGPSGPNRHLWPVYADATTGSGDQATDPDPPPAGDRGSALASVPEPEGGFEFGILEVVVLPDGVPWADIEPGARATVVAVHREPEPGYEVEVSDTDGSRRWLGIVPRDAVTRA